MNPMRLLLTFHHELYVRSGGRIGQGYDAYQKLTDRPIPVVVLDPRSS